MHGHCHQKALVGMEPTRQVPSKVEGLEFSILDSGCCGMAGSFGYEQGHYEVSQACGERVLFPAVRGTAADDLVVAPASAAATRSPTSATTAAACTPRSCWRWRGEGLFRAGIKKWTTISEYGAMQMSAENRFGLKRDIPEPVRREVRQRCGFGCVICGMAVCQYEHIEPEFADAEKHDPAAITLLCGRCHDKVTRGLLSKETVKFANAAPKALEKGFSFETFDIGPVRPDVRLGPLLAIRPHTVIRAFGEDLFGVAEPEQPGGPFRLRAVFADREGRETFRIKENTWETPTDNWDVDVTGPRITLRKGPGDLVLQLRVAPPQELVVERLDMYFRGLRIVADEKSGFSIETPQRTFFQTHNMTLDDCEVVFDVQENGEFIVGCNCAEEQYIEEFRFGPLPSGMSATDFRQNRERQTNMTIPSPKTPRNARCPCGSGRKYKQCHGKPS